MKDLKPIIAQHSFLRGMKPEHLEILARHAREVQFDAGQVIFRQNEAAYEFFLIMAGQVTVESYVPRADNVSLQVIGSGDVLGWSWLFPPFTWHFQARALERTRAVVIDGARLLVACENNADLGYELMQRIAQLVITRLQATRKGFPDNFTRDALLNPVDETCFCERQPAPIPEDLQTALETHPFFRGCKTEYLQILRKAAMKTEFHAGQSIFREGEVANRFYLIQQGKVLLESPKTDVNSVPIQIIGDGDVLGWSWLFPPFYWHFDARALVPTKCIFLYGTRLREECAANHPFGYDLMKRVCQVLIKRLQVTRKQLLRFRELGASKQSEGIESGANKKETWLNLQIAPWPANGEKPLSNGTTVPL